MYICVRTYRIISENINIIINNVITENFVSFSVNSYFYLFFFFFKYFGHTTPQKDTSSPTRDRPVPPAVEAWSPNYWTPREVPTYFYL